MLARTSQRRIFDMIHRFCALTFLVALTFLACANRPASAQPVPSATSEAERLPTIAHPYSQDPGELEAALLASDPASAVSFFRQFTCASYNNIEAARVVRRAWDRRDSVDATGALQD